MTKIDVIQLPWVQKLVKKPCVKKAIEKPPVTDVQLKSLPTRQAMDVYEELLEEGKGVRIVPLLKCSHLV
ncbi:hypothetical protein P3498_00790 [Vibrio parahaemolyticus]|uniref:hypothetical protein n=1 Tax=Vibrio parahaemolyticus TaxID=670 RepID=UPI001173A427|nr:hypothetical protein [Vibrio parahaemolyticus]EJG2036913.1 hypothetical protein [Vibrio parahaemolyticus]EJG2232164.1 hypothetical protein [Vibrio parahaemolyticus]MDF4614315.1 hypothetical protein [Vibrio parahaemolyticus]TOB38623.1 hypothetical protein CGK06_23350 [Vibrio parahaemolyticus]TOC01789.1 hypothetical protein CGJ94_24500 [Vibrio parahaemolyticus]